VDLPLADNKSNTLTLTKSVPVEWINDPQLNNGGSATRPTYFYQSKAFAILAVLGMSKIYQFISLLSTK